MSIDTSVAALSPADQLVNGAKLVGDVAFTPGTSLLVDGKILEGSTHAVVGHLAMRLIGPVGWILVAANSYSKSSSGSSLYGHISGYIKSKRAKKAISTDTAASSAAPTVAGA